MAMDDDFISRTANGLFAEATVRDVSFIFHIEGKGETHDVTKLPDYIFYNAIISSFFDDSYEIKVEGGKTKLKAMINNLSTIHDGTISHAVIMDRDHDEIIGDGLINNGFVYYTCGYSYENDFWTSKILRKVISSFCADETIIDGFVSDWKILERKISFIHKFNLISKANGNQIFKFRGLCGVLFKYENGSFVINPDCWDRFKNSWNGGGIRSTSKTKEITKFLKKEFYSHPGYLIQGHAYESYTLEVIHQIYGICQYFDENVKSFGMYKNIAFSHFIKSPNNYLSSSTIQHYKGILDSIHTD